MAAGLSGASVWRHLAAPGLTNNDGKMSSIRVLGTALTWTNLAPPQYREGQIYSVQVSKAHNWLTIAKPNGLGATASGVITNIKGFCHTDAVKGHYTFLKPVSHDSFKFQQNLKFNSTPAVIDSCYPLNHWDQYIVIYAVVNSLVANAQDSCWKLHTAYEYETDDLITEIETAPYNEQLFQRVILSMRALSQHYENPTHWENLKNWFNTNVPKVINAVETALPYVLKGIGVAKDVASLI